MVNRWSRLAPLTGIVFVVLLVASFVVGGSTPGVHASGAKVISFYQAHGSKQKISAYLSVLGVVFLVFFAASLRSHFGHFEGARGLATLGFGGALVLAVGGAAFAAISWSLADARSSVDPSAAQALNVLSNDFFWPFGVGVAVFGIGYGLAVAGSKALPAWLGWIALLLGILGMTPISFFAFLALMVWSLVTSVLVFRRGIPSAGAPAGAPSRS
jgi:hypothetical protein